MCSKSVHEVSHSVAREAERRPAHVFDLCVLEKREDADIERL